MLRGHSRVTDWPNFNIVMSQGIGKLEEGGVSKRGGETDEGVDREEGKKRKGEREREMREQPAVKQLYDTQPLSLLVWR